MTIPAPLQRFVDDELSLSEGLAERTLNGTLEQLRQPRDGMLSTNERQHYFALVEALQKHGAAFRREFASQLKTLVQADLAGLESVHDEPSDPTGGLQLMDETRVESDIEISRAAQLIDGSAEWELRELQTFVSTLAGRKHVTPESNPLRPMSYARALWQAGCLVSAVPLQRGLLLRTAAGVLSGQLKKAWAAACTRLEAQGVEPGIYRTVVFQPGASMHAPRFDLTKPGALEDLLATMPAGSAATAPGATTPSSAAGAASSQPAFEASLQNLEALLRQAQATLGAAPQPTELRARLLATAGTSPDRQIIELLSRLFEAVLADERLPAALRTAMTRLQVATLRVALVDPSMLGTQDHPVWQLMNRMAVAAETYPQASDPRLAALVAYCDGLVDEIARAPSPDATAYKRARMRLDAYLAEQLREQLARAQAAVATLTLAERRGDLERELARRLSDQMVSIRTSAAIRRFITGAWATVLADSMLRFGDKVEPTVGYLRTVDELLWSLRLPDHPQSRQRLVALLPGLLQRLRAGMAQIALADAEQQAVLDELMSVHTEALKPGGKNAAPEAETAQQIVQRLRDEVISDTPSRLPFSDSLIDLSSMDTVPADQLDDAPAPTDDPARRIEAMAPGARYRLFLHGRWTRVELLWRSARGEFFLFAGEAPLRTHSVTQRALERLSEERLALPLEDPSLIQRAVDRLVRTLALPTV